MTKDEAINIFKDSGAILSGHFLLTSGRHSDTYMQCAKLFVYPNKAQKLCAALCDKLKDKKIDLVASPAVGGIIMGYEVARQLNVPNVFFERENGEMVLRRGFEIKKGANVLVVEDVVTTGGSVKEVIAKVKEMGANVVAVSSIVDRSNGKVDFGVDFVNVLSLDVMSYEPEECPLCKQGIPAVKPGSRNLK